MSNVKADYRRSIAPVVAKTRRVTPASELEDTVYNRCGVLCQIRIKSDGICVRTRDFADYLLAKSVIAHAQENLSITREQ